MPGWTEESHKNSDRVLYILAKIQVSNLLNTSQKYYLLSLHALLFIIENNSNTRKP